MARRYYENTDGYRTSYARLSLRYLVLAVVVLISVGPFLWQFATSLKDLGENPYASPPQFIPRHPTLANYLEVGQVIPVWRYVANSLFVALCNVTLNVVGAALAGYALARLRFRGRMLAMGVFVTALLIPLEANMISLLQIVNGMGLANTLVAVFLPTAVSALNVLLMTNAFRALPHEVEEAAVIDGANAWQRFWHLSVPSARGTIAVVALLSFMGSWNDFLWPLLVLTDPDNYTLSVGLNYLKGTFQNNPRLIAAGTMIAILPLVALFLALQKVFFSGVGEGAVKG